MVPVIFHNLSGYVAPFLIKTLASEMKGNMFILSFNEEKYVAFTKYIENTNINLRFFDSFRFMPDSLHDLSCSSVEELNGFWTNPPGGNPNA